MTKRLLNRNAADFVQPQVIGRFLQRRERRRGFVVAHALLALHPGVGAQPQHVVVSKTSATERASKHVLLLGRWVKPEPVGAFNFHSQSIVQLCKVAIQKGKRVQGHAARAALSLPGLKAEVSRAN